MTPPLLSFAALLAMGLFFAGDLYAGGPTSVAAGRAPAAEAAAQMTAALR